MCPFTTVKVAGGISCYFNKNFEVCSAVSLLAWENVVASSEENKFIENIESSFSEHSLLIQKLGSSSIKTEI